MGVGFSLDTNCGTVKDLKNEYRIEGLAQC